MSSPPQAHIACVSPDGPSWFQRVFTLAVSVRNFGGRLSGAPMDAYFVESLDGLHRLPLEGLGVRTSIVGAFPASQPQTNKLRMFEAAAAAERGDGVLVALDCDVAVLADISPALSTSAVRATAASTTPMTVAAWDRLLEAVGLRRGGPEVQLHLTGERLPVPYVNSGVLFVPDVMVGVLTERWAEWIRRLDPADPASPLPPAAVPYLDQVALTCALLDTGIPLELLDLSYNFHTKPPELRAVAGIDQVRIAHYHRWVDRHGRPRPPSYPPLVPAIERLNRVVDARLGAAAPAVYDPVTIAGDEARLALGRVQRQLRRRVGRGR